GRHPNGGELFDRIVLTRPIGAGWPGGSSDHRRVLNSDRGSILEEPDRELSVEGRPGQKATVMGSIGSESGRSPNVTRHHGQEGADARGDRNTHSAPGRLWDLSVGSRRRRQHADPVDPADGPGAVLHLWRLWDLGARDPQLDGAAAAGFALGDL